MLLEKQFSLMLQNFQALAQFFFQTREIDDRCTVLYDILRPKLIHEADLVLLCELVEILKGEVLEEELGRRGESVAGLKPTIIRILADVQERLTFRAQTHMRDEV